MCEEKETLVNGRQAAREYFEAFLDQRLYHLAVNEAKTEPRRASVKSGCHVWHLSV